MTDDGNIGLRLKDDSATGQTTETKALGQSVHNGIGVSVPNI